MKQVVSHERSEESLEAKARWFQTLTTNERAEMLCYFTDLMLSVNPGIIEHKDVEPIEGRILVVSKA